MAVVGSMEIAAAGVDETVLFTEGGALGFVLRAVAGVLHLNAIDHPLFDQLPHQRHTLVDRRVSKNDDCPGCFGRSQYIPHRAVFRRVEHDAPGVPPEEIVVQAGIDPVTQAQLMQGLHDAALVEHAAVLGVLQRLLGAELRVKRLDLPSALQTALVAALAHDVAVFPQGFALRVGPERQQVHPVAALVVVARQLRGRDEPHTILCGMVIAVLDAEEGIVVRNRHGVQPHPCCHKGQAVDGHRAIRTG